MAVPDGPMQSRHKSSETLCKRAGINGLGKDHLFNRRRRGTAKELGEWIKYYENKVSKGEYCPIRAAKIISRFKKALGDVPHGGL